MCETPRIKKDELGERYLSFPRSIKPGNRNLAGYQYQFISNELIPSCSSHRDVEIRLSIMRLGESSYVCFPPIVQNAIVKNLEGEILQIISRENVTSPIGFFRMLATTDDEDGFISPAFRGRLTIDNFLEYLDQDMKSIGAAWNS